MRVILPHSRFITLAFAFLALLILAPAISSQPDAQPAGASWPDQMRAPHPKLFVSSEHRMPEEMWTALFTALDANIAEVTAVVPAGAAHPEFIRGDDPTKEDHTGQGITVYLRGDCLPPDSRLPFPQGQSLGWVNEVDGRIVPIIHAECTQIGAAISRRMQGMNRSERNAAMAKAIARVILHEWVHVATQSAAHGPDGISKAGFGARDLLCGDRTPDPSGSGKESPTAFCGSYQAASAR